MSRIFAWVSAAALSAIVVFSFRYERYQPVVACCAVLVFVVCIRTGRWLPLRRTLVVTLATDLALIFLYLWSLDERAHVVLVATPSGYVASVDGKTLPLRAPGIAGGIGLVTSGVGGYKTQWSGEAPSPPATSLLARFVEFVRFAAPRPAWTNVSLTDPQGATRILPLSRQFSSPPASWAVNRRGELEGTPGSYTMFDVPPQTTFTLQADLARGDGTQGIIVGADRDGNGHVFAIQTDGAGCAWLAWRHGQLAALQSATGLPLLPLSMIQRDIRLLLSNVMVGLMLILLAAPLYAMLAWLLGHLAGKFKYSVRGVHPLVPDVASGIAAVVATVTSAAIATNVLERVPHIRDSVVYYFQAQTFALGRLWVPAPKMSDFFSIEEALIQGGRWFGQYPPGWPILLAGGIVLGIPWLVNPVLTGVNVLLTYWIGRQAYGKCTGLLAALLALSSPLLMLLGSEYLSHTATIFYLNMATFLLVRWKVQMDRGFDSMRGEWRTLVPAGFFAGLAFMTREFDAILFFLPFPFLLARRPLLRSLRSLLLSCAGSAPPVGFFLFYNATLTGSPVTVPVTLIDANDRPGFGFAEGMFTNFSPADGLWNASSNLESLRGQLFGWPFYFTLALAAVPFLIGRARRWDALFAASSGTVIVGYVTYWGADITYGPRHWAAAVPGLIFLTARGFEELYHWTLRFPWSAKRDPLAASLVPGLLLVLLLACNLSIYLPLELPIYRVYNRASGASIRAVKDAGIHNSLVFIRPGSGNWDVYEVPFTQSSPLLNGDIVYARDLGTRNRTLMRRYPRRKIYLLERTRLRQLTR